MLEVLLQGRSLGKFSFQVNLWAMLMYSAAMSAVLVNWAANWGGRVARPILVFTATWHVILAALSADLVFLDHAHQGAFFHTFYGAATLGALTGLSWILLSGRSQIRSREVERAECMREVSSLITTSIKCALEDLEPDSH